MEQPVEDEIGDVEFASKDILKGTISVGTLNNWRLQGRGPAYIKAGPKKVLYSKKALLDWLSKNTISSNKN